MTYTTCCGLFESSLSVEGNQGLSIVPVCHPKFGNFFLLEFCAIAKAKFGLVELSKDERVTVAVKQAIKYCPFCGANLAEFYKTTFLNLPHLSEEEWSVPHDRST